MCTAIPRLFIFFFFYLARGEEIQILKSIPPPNATRRRDAPVIFAPSHSLRVKTDLEIIFRS